MQSEEKLALSLITRAGEVLAETLFQLNAELPFDSWYLHRQLQARQLVWKYRSLDQLNALLTRLATDTHSVILRVTKDPVRLHPTFHIIHVNFDALIKRLQILTVLLSTENAPNPTKVVLPTSSSSLSSMTPDEIKDLLDYRQPVEDEAEQLECQMEEWLRKPIQYATHEALRNQWAIPSTRCVPYRIICPKVDTDICLDMKCPHVHLERIVQYDRKQIKRGKCVDPNWHDPSSCPYDIHYRISWAGYQDRIWAGRVLDVYKKAFNDAARSAHHETDTSSWSQQQWFRILKSEGMFLTPEHRPSLSSVSPAQWINCEVTEFPLGVVGLAKVLMMDPPWMINSNVPYKTMTDEENLNLDVPSLQRDGYIFLWVTGRTMELGRECLKKWGYEKVDEIVWVKVDGTNCITRYGKTGYFLNHSKEHCLVGVKGDYKTGFHPGIDCNVIVSRYREASRKPDDIYGIIDRLCPLGRKVEIFGRKHNRRNGWITLGNQLGDTFLHEPNLQSRYRQYLTASKPAQVSL